MTAAPKVAVGKPPQNIQENNRSRPSAGAQGGTERMPVKDKSSKNGNKGVRGVTAPQRFEQDVCDFCRGAGHSMKTCELFSSFVRKQISSVPS